MVSMSPPRNACDSWDGKASILSAGRMQSQHQDQQTTKTRSSSLQQRVCRENAKHPDLKIFRRNRVATRRIFENKCKLEERKKNNWRKKQILLTDRKEHVVCAVQTEIYTTRRAGCLRSTMQGCTCHIMLLRTEFPEDWDTDTSIRALVCSVCFVYKNETEDRTFKKGLSAVLLFAAQSHHTACIQSSE